MKRILILLFVLAAVCLPSSLSEAQGFNDLGKFTTYGCSFTAKSVRVLSAQEVKDEPGDPLTVYILADYRQRTAVMSEASSGYVEVTAMLGAATLHLISATSSENLITVTIFGRTSSKTTFMGEPAIIYRAAMSRHLPGVGAEGVVAQYDGTCRGVS